MTFEEVAVMLWARQNGYEVVNVEYSEKEEVEA